MRRIGSIFPTYFTFVMATGILSVGAERLSHDVLAHVLLGFTLPGYGVVWICGLSRLISSPVGLWRDFCGHASGPVFLSSVAATAVLGSSSIAVGLPIHFAGILFAAAVVAWVVLIYGFLAMVTEGHEKPSIETGLNGGWLLIVVSTASLSVLGSDIMRLSGASPALSFVCYVWLALAWLYYALLGSMIFYRFVFVPMPSQDITGPWWINAGAAAVTVLAGCQLLAQPGLTIGVFRLHDLIAPLIIIFWADATFWIPLLVILFAWKHFWGAKPFRYSADLWAVVFPMGMYAAATLQFSQTFTLPFIMPLAQTLFWAALVLWMASVIGMALHATGLDPEVAASR